MIIQDEGVDEIQYLKVGDIHGSEKTSFTANQVGESDQRFVVLKRSNGHYTLLCTQVSLTTEKKTPMIFT